MFERDSFTVEEWGQIISAPASIGALVVTADPSGPLGLIGEFRAIMNSMKDYVDANAAASPLLNAMKDYINSKPTDEEEAQMKEWAKQQQEEMEGNRPESAEAMGNMVRERTAATLSMLRGRGATDNDILAFKRMVYAVAEATANASKEGGFLGFGGTLVSDAEQSVLARIKEELGV